MATVTLTDWAALAGNLFALVIVAILAAPLLFLRREAAIVVAGIVASFLIGFAGPFLDRTGHLALAATGLGLVIAMPVAVGRRSETSGAAAMASAAFVPLASIALGYGIYAARSTGWHGLTTLGGESSDMQGAAVVWLFFISLSPVWAILAIVSGVAARMIFLKGGSY